MSLVKMWLIGDEEQPYFWIRDQHDTVINGGQIRVVGQFEFCEISAASCSSTSSTMSSIVQRRSAMLERTGIVKVKPPICSSCRANSNAR